MIALITLEFASYEENGRNINKRSFDFSFDYAVAVHILGIPTFSAKTVQRQSGTAALTIKTS